MVNPLKMAALLVVASAGAGEAAMPLASQAGNAPRRQAPGSNFSMGSTFPESHWKTEALAPPETPPPAPPPPANPPRDRPGTPPPAPAQPGTPAPAKPQRLDATNSTNSNKTPAPVSQINTSTDYTNEFIATGVLSFFYCICSLRTGCNVHPMNILMENTSPFFRVISNIFPSLRGESPLPPPRGEPPLPPLRGEPPLPPPREEPPLPPPREESPLPPPSSLLSLRGESPLPPPQEHPPSDQAQSLSPPPDQARSISSAPFPITNYGISAQLTFDNSPPTQQEALRALRALRAQPIQQQLSAQLGFSSLGQGR